jgi:hypothetical protein
MLVTVVVVRCEVLCRGGDGCVPLGRGDDNGVKSCSDF